MRGHALGNACERQHALSDAWVPFLGGQLAQCHWIGIQLAWARLALALPSCKRQHDPVANDDAQPRFHRVWPHERGSRCGRQSTGRIAACRSRPNESEPVASVAAPKQPRFPAAWLALDQEAFLVLGICVVCPGGGTAIPTAELALASAQHSPAWPSRARSLFDGFAGQNSCQRPPDADEPQGDVRGRARP